MLNPPIFTTNGTPCKFPFKYKKVEHNKCIPDKKGKLWCATSVKPTGTYDGKGYCADAAKAKATSGASDGDGDDDSDAMAEAWARGNSVR